MLLVFGCVHTYGSLCMVDICIHSIMQLCFHNSIETFSEFGGAFVMRKATGTITLLAPRASKKAERCWGSYSRSSGKLTLRK